MVVEWPASDLDAVDNCPVCGSKDRRILYADLTDRIFYCAPGIWKLYQCQTCASAYLNPRPTVDSIGRAYEQYYTHTVVSNHNQSENLLFGKLRYALRNGYLNQKYNYQLKPAIKLGFLLAYLFPFSRSREDRWVRHLHFPGQNARLLDIGCGNGHFLIRMQGLGWKADGIDPDYKAIEAVKDFPVTVQQGMISNIKFAADIYDAVTLNHVIEHIHDPLSAIQICYQILRPGGVLWIATPNLNAHGHRLFGKNWRGIEPPRHLCLFNKQSLERIVLKTGFDILPDPLADPTAESYYLMSLAIAKGEKTTTTPPHLPASLKWKAWLADRVAILNPQNAEELVIIARKPMK